MYNCFYGVKMKNKYLECGKIINTHGVAGTVKVENRCDTPKILASLKRIYFKVGDLYDEKKVLSGSVMGQFVLLKLDGVTDLDGAAALKNTLIYADREDLPIEEGAVFIADLIGLPVIDVDDGREYGKLSEVMNRGASDIYVVDTPSGERMMPAVAEFVKSIDVEKGIFVKPIQGMFDDAE